MMVAPGSLRNRVAGIYALLFAANGAAWAAAFLVFHDHPVLLGTAAVAVDCTTAMTARPTTQATATNRRLVIAPTCPPICSTGAPGTTCPEG